MDKVKKYQAITLKILNEFAAIKSPFTPEVENRVIADTANHQYQLIRLGWDEGKHVHYCVFHFDIIKGKVWLQENRTDVKITDELIEAGIPKEGIVLGFPIGNV